MGEQQQKRTGATMSVAETARVLGCAPRTVSEAVKRGDLPVIKLGLRVRIVRAGLEKMLADAAKVPAKVVNDN